MTKYMLVMRSSDEAFAKFETLDFGDILDAIGRFNDELIRAGVLVAAEGLDPDGGVVVDFVGEAPVVSTGPYGETEALFNGYYIIDVASIDEAVEWAKRLPYSEGAKVEIRRVTSIDEFPQENPWIQKERAWRERTGQL